MPSHGLTALALNLRKPSRLSEKAFIQDVTVVTRKKEDGRETTVDQWDVDINKVADVVLQTEYVCEELSRFEALVYWNLEKE